ncbi:MAG: glycogen synthase GlgA [Ruminococcaceae bacterium]|nr:glycogen synthase GlgA [Oscillospiraceae bacterium]
MKILYAASEALPFASTGGLADVVGSLPQAVKKELGRNSDVRVVIPLYPSIREKFSEELELIKEITVKLCWRNQYCGILKTVRDGVTFYFIDNEYYFNRKFLYGSFDDGERFAFFCKAIIELMAAVNFYPDVLHANDWQTALSVIYLKKKYAHLEEYRGISTLFTIHNIGYQGIYGFELLKDIFDLDEWDRSVVEYNGCINLLKGAIVCSDLVSTVSSTYAREILTEYYSSGLHHILRDISASGKLVGIVNGIDVDYYNSETDPEIAEHFSADSPEGKVKCKEDLQELCGFEIDNEIPIIASVSRLASHKGFDLVRHVMDEIIEKNKVRFVLLGTGEFELEDYFVKLQNRYPDRVCIKLEYNKALSKKFYAGADMFLMPSKSEPCGLAQMIASRYGTVPIVRETGGLADTIKPYNEYDETGNGFTFCNYNAHDMMHVIEYAISMYCDQSKWAHLVKNVINTDFSWSVSAKKYIEIYETIV